MNKNVIFMATIILVVAAGTYFGLELLAGKPESETVEVVQAPEATPAPEAAPAA